MRMGNSWGGARCCGTEEKLRALFVLEKQEVADAYILLCIAYLPELVPGASLFMTVIVAGGLKFNDFDNNIAKRIVGFANVTWG